MGSREVVHVFDQAIEEFYDTYWLRLTDEDKKEQTTSLREFI